MVGNYLTNLKKKTMLFKLAILYKVWKFMLWFIHSLLLKKFSFIKWQFLSRSHFLCSIGQHEMDLFPQVSNLKEAPLNKDLMLKALVVFVVKGTC